MEDIQINQDILDPNTSDQVSQGELESVQGHEESLILDFIFNEM